MPVTSRTPLGAPTHTRKYWVDVAPLGSSSWLPVMGISSITANLDNPTTNDVSDNDSDGFKSNSKDAATWGVDFTVFRKVLNSDATSYDPGQEFLRLKAIGQFGPNNTVQVRIYEMEPGGPRVEAYLGVANVTWQAQAGNMEADDTVQVTLNGNGLISPIAHPDTGSAVPTLSSITPSTGLATAGGTLVTIRGTRFTGATAVAFAGTAATSFTVQSDGQIAAVSPAKAAGTYAVTVTNAAGASTVTQSVTYV